MAHPSHERTKDLVMLLRFSSLMDAVGGADRRQYDEAEHQLYDGLVAFFRKHFPGFVHPEDSSRLFAELRKTQSDLHTAHAEKRSLATALEQTVADFEVADKERQALQCRLDDIKFHDQIVTLRVQGVVDRERFTAQLVSIAPTRP